MQPDYTFAPRIDETLSSVRRRLQPFFTIANTTACKQQALLYAPRQRERLIKLADDMTTISLLTRHGLTKEQILADLITSNLGSKYLNDASQASRGPFLLCDRFVPLMVRSGEYH
jgi:hypothetical protein